MGEQAKNVSNALTVTLKEAGILGMDVLRAGLVPFFQSSPGIGKSSLAHQIAEKFNLKVIDLRLSQMDPADLNGFPFMDGDTASYKPMDIFPLEGNEVPEGFDGWLILLDELNSAPLSIQAAAYKLILDRMVGMLPLHRKVAIIAAGNLASDKAIVNRVGTAMQSRLVHFEIRVDHKAFMEYANAKQFDHRVRAFLNFKPKLLHNFSPDHSDKTFPCPRTWEFVSRMIKPMEDLPFSKLPLVAGAIGEGAAREFMSYTRVYKDIPDIARILKDPTGIPVKNEPSVHYALSGLVAHHATKDNIETLMPFLMRLNVEFQVVALKAMIAKDRAIKTQPAVKEWIKYNAAEMRKG